MSLRKLFRTVLRTTGTIMSGPSFLYSNDTNNKKPTEDEKLIFEPLDVTKFTPEYMLKQSTVDAVNCATQTLTVTYMAILTASNEYKTLLIELISLSKDTLQFHVTEKHWDMIVELRTEVQAKKDTLNKLSGYVDYVHKMATAATEISYLSGMDNLSFTLSQRIDDALRNIKEEFNSLASLEQEYCEIQEKCIRNTKVEDSDNQQK